MLLPFVIGSSLYHSDDSVFLPKLFVVSGDIGK